MRLLRDTRAWIGLVHRMGSGPPIQRFAWQVSVSPTEHSKLLAVLNGLRGLTEFMMGSYGTSRERKLSSRQASVASQQRNVASVKDFMRRSRNLVQNTKMGFVPVTKKGRQSRGEQTSQRGWMTSALWTSKAVARAEPERLLPINRSF